MSKVSIQQIRLHKKFEVLLRFSDKIKMDEV